MKKGKQLAIADGRVYLSTEEAARALGINPATLRGYLSAGKLTTYKFKTLTLIKIDEVDHRRSSQKKR